MDKDYDYCLKLITLGDPNVGKTSLILRYTDSEFVENRFFTVGIDFKVERLTCRGRRVKAYLWDTAGQERFRILNAAYYRRAEAAVIVFDMSDRETFERVRHWHRDLKAKANMSPCVFLVGNKCDLGDERQVSFEEAKGLADELGVFYIETSARNSTNVNELFVGIL
eukprot:CAMPEP_0204903728 /NCGR_PEP_ID=MMETSP1397-20131031/4448_1 /ASSEMBLY_ACC=CAM_ASM_000891 /TAXON_ID=49980 /ORGANISM="Climacostomum Climacostomum virens, Strain Stock W-24" /LENGTH=166 /DNA_ID=CAMNT_0052072425 /DNA_START=326 /DNA_END=823 /DNA_ORIENTATION=-